MSNVRMLRPLNVKLESGWIDHVRADGTMCVDLSDHSVWARRAASCLVMPGPGDHVLVAKTGDTHSFILAILERKEPGTTIMLDSDVDIAVRGGALSLAADAGINLLSASRVAVVADDAHLTVRAAELSFETLSAVGGFFRAQIGAVRTVARSIETLAERLSEHLGRADRVVAERDYVYAEEVDHSARETLAMRGRNVILAAEALTKVDGDQVHVG